jgi:hypothetical protein
MKLEDYSSFRDLLCHHNLYYDVDLETNEYVVWDKNGDTVVSIPSDLVRNNYEAASDTLITAVNTVTVFGGN